MLLTKFIQRLSLVAIALVLAGTMALQSAPTAYAADSVTEIHYSYGDTPNSVAFDWRGAETTIYYGTSPYYDHQAVASASAITPLDSAGPYQEVLLNDVAPGTTYYYQIGLSGDMHTFTTAPTDDFSWVDTGDTSATYCGAYNARPWMAEIQQLIADQNPNFVTHGGDISYANECGVPAVHQLYVDQEAWSHGAAFMPVWGNHEYGPTNAESVPGAIQDSLTNYKGRSRIPNAQTVSIDTATRTSNPGCSSPGISGNSCRGEDWGYFTTGHVMYIAYPEPWVTAQANWEGEARTIMTAAQNDPNIDFIVTYGHRPAFSSILSGGTEEPVSADLRTAVTNLAHEFAPSTTNPSGKYIMTIGHHIHGGEIIKATAGNGLGDDLTFYSITNGGGGAGQASYKVGSYASGSLYRLQHPEILSSTYDAAAHSLTVNMICGPAYPPKVKDVCTKGAVLQSLSFTRPSSVPADPALTTALGDGVTSLQVNQQTTYNAQVTNTQGNSTAHDVALTVTVPANMSIVSVTGGGLISGNSVSWSVGSLNGGQSASQQVTAKLLSGNPGDPFTAELDATSTDYTACSGGNCMALDTNTVAATPTSACPLPPAGSTERSGNLSLETDQIGWTGIYNSNSVNSRVSGGSFDGQWGLKLAPKAAGYAGVNNASPNWVTSSVAGKVYTGSAYVKSSVSGLTVNLLILEVTPGGSTVSTHKTTVTYNDTAWHSLSSAYTALNSGNLIKYSLFGSNFTSTSQNILADCLSLTSTN